MRSLVAALLVVLALAFLFSRPACAAVSGPSLGVGVRLALGASLAAASSDADDEEEEDEDEKPAKASAKAGKKAPGKAGRKAAAKAEAQLAKQAAAVLEGVGLGVPKGMTVTSVHVVYHDADGAAKSKADGKAEADGKALAKADITLVGPLELPELVGYFETRIAASLVVEKYAGHASQVLVRSPYKHDFGRKTREIQVLVERRRGVGPVDPNDRRVKVTPDEAPEGLVGVVHKLVSKPKRDPRAEARSRLEQLLWHHVDVEKNWLTAKLGAEKRAAFVKAMAPIDEELEELLFDLGDSLGRPVRPADIKPAEGERLRGAYHAVFARFAPGPMPVSRRLRIERREALQLEAGLAGLAFVRIRVDQPARSAGETAAK